MRLLTAHPPLKSAGPLMRLPTQPRRAGELAFDGSSAAVRGAVLRGLVLLVPNPLAHPLLARLLPQMAPLAHDSALAVRTAMADLLLAIKCALCSPPPPAQLRSGRCAEQALCRIDRRADQESR